MILGKEVSTRKMACLCCGTLLDKATPVGRDATPEAEGTGETCVSMCAECGHLQVFIKATDGGLGFRELTDAEMVDIAGNPELVAMSRLVADFWKWRKQTHAE